MAILNDHPIRTLSELRQFEAAMPLEQRLTERSVLDVFISAAQRQPERTAITMVMTGAPDEQARRVSCRELLGLVRRAANLFARLGGPRPGVAYMLPSLIETHATLWGAESAGYAVPINFLLQVEHIAALLEASGARILVALGPHPVLDIWQKALQLRERVPGLVLVRVAPPGMPAEAGVIDFHTALMAQPDDHLVFGEPGRDDDVAAWFHTGGTTGTPRLVAHTHSGQLAAALGGAVLGDMRPSDTLTATLPYTGVEVRRLGGDGRLGDPCAAGEVGVITVRGPNVSPGYRNPAHDAGVLEGGVLNSGDLGYTDEAGRIHIAGRSKDLIIRSGHNIDPVMIENAMAEHPAVALAAAVGMPDAYAGELPVCFIVLRAGSAVSDAELHAHAQRAIGERPAWPRQFHIVDAIPVTSVGKIFKPQLRCDAAQRLVSGVLREQHRLPDAQVRVSAGGPRGLIVDVTLPPSAAPALPAVTHALTRYLFEARVAIA